MSLRRNRPAPAHRSPLNSFRRRSTVHLNVEQLEDRTTPAPLTSPVPVASVAYNNVNALPVISNLFASDLVQDMFQRGPDAATVSNLTSQLNKGQINGGQAFASLIASPEFQSQINPLLSMYQVYLGRPADSTGLFNAADAEHNGFPLGLIATNIAQSPEFIAKNGNISNMSNTAFLNFVYNKVLNRAPDAAGLASYTAALNKGVSKGDILAQFVQTPEFGQKQVNTLIRNYETMAYLALWRKEADSKFESNVSQVLNGTVSGLDGIGNQFINDSNYIAVGTARNYVIGAYEGTLYRDPDFSSFRIWRDALLSKQTSDQDMFAALMATPEHQQIVAPIETMYTVFFGRAPDAPGLTVQTSAVRNGAPLAQVLLNLASSPEFIAKNGDVAHGSQANLINFLSQVGLKRTMSASDVAALSANVGTGPLSAGILFQGFVTAPEFQKTNADAVNQMQIGDGFRAFLSRSPVGTEAAALLPNLTGSGGSLSKVARAILTGTEFTGNSFAQNIQHVIVIYQENWSFDALYGSFPGANGLANAAATIPQVDRFGNPLTSAPQPTNGGPDARFPSSIPIGPYNLNKYIQTSDKTGDIVHRFYTEQLQIDNGLIDKSNGSMDKFVTYSDNGGLVQSNFDATSLPEGLLAQQYTMDDNFFHSAFGGSYLNHQFLIAAQAPQWAQPIPSASWVSSFDPVTKKLNDGQLTSDGKYGVNTIFSSNLVPNFVTPGSNTLENSINDSNPNDPTRPYEQNIGDELSSAGVSWKWYSGGWNAAVNLQKAYQTGDKTQIAAAQAPFNDTKNPLNLFQWHHQPFAYFDNTAPLSANGQAHLQDEQNYFSDLTSGGLPAVSFIKPLGPDNEHPGYASLLQGQQHVAALVQALQNSPYWGNTAIVITYDEHGGRWDHVTPPKVDQWGVGERVPTIDISPFAKRGVVDHTQLETDSILKTLEQMYRLKALANHDANAAAIYSSFSFSPTDLINANRT